METTAPVFYRASGKCPSVALVLGVIAMLVAGTILGVAYAHAIYFCPFIYINFFLTLGFGWVVGIAVGRALKAGKLRNNRAAVITGLLAGIFALYVSWITWIFIASDGDVVAILPTHLLAIMSILTEEGVWEIFGWTPTGFALWAIWLVEAAMVVGMATLITRATIDEIFCEHCNRWVGKEEVQARNLDYGEDPGHFQLVMESVVAGDPLQLNTLQPAEAGSAQHLECETSGCKTCEALNFLTLRTVEISMDDKGKQDVNKEDLVSRMFLTPTQVEALRTGALPPPVETTPPPGPQGAI